MKTITLFIASLFLIVFSASSLQAQDENESDISIKNKGATIYGTLRLGAKDKPTIVALIIAGSGPTDRNGNQPQAENNSLNMLANALGGTGISSVRYDKRGVGQSKIVGLKEETLTFEDYISDAEVWINTLKADKRFTKVVVIGHSEGSLIGMVACQHTNADVFVSISGAGRPAYEVIMDQLKDQPKDMQYEAGRIIDVLKTGQTTENVPGYLYSLFRPSVQPYMISWFKYNPSDEFKKLKIPAVIVHGMNDIQVNLDEAMKLAEARPKASLMVVKGMNHILKKMDENKEKNKESYNDPHLPLSVDLVSGLIEYIYNNAR